MKLWRALVAILLLVGADGKKNNVYFRGKPQATSSGQQSTAGSTLVDPCGLNEPFDVLVVGLGWAGTCVLKELENYKDFLAEECSGSNCGFKTVGLEHEDHVGGRAVAAELVSGGGNPITEFMFELFSQNPNKEDYLLYTEHKWSDITYFHSNGTEISERDVNTDRNAWADAFECLQEKALLSGMPPGVPDNRLLGMDDILVDQCAWDESPALRKLFRWYELQWEFLHSTENNNGFGNVPLLTYTGEYQDKDLFVSTNRNCARILDAVLKKYVEDYQAKIDAGNAPEVVRLNTTVTSINWNSNPIKVTVQGADPAVPNPCVTYFARRVVVTASVGMLKKYLDTPLPDSPFDAPFFVPALPPKKRDAIGNTFFKEKDNGVERDDMGLYKKLVVQLDKETYKKYVKRNRPNSEFDFVVPVPPITTYSDTGIGGSDIFCSLWQNLDRFQKEFFDGSRAFVCTLVTKEFEAATPPATRILPHDTANDIIRLNLFKGVLGLSVTQIGNIGDCARVDGPRGPLTLFPPEAAQQVDSPSWTGYEEYYTPSNPLLQKAKCVYQIFDGPELVFPVRPGDPRPTLWNGAWPNFMTGWTNADYACARANLDSGATACEEGADPVLLFAGDAMCPRFFAFQHGAVQSGIQIANKIVAAELRGFPDVLNKWRSEYETYEGCDDYDPAGGPGNYRRSKSLP